MQTHGHEQSNSITKGIFIETKLIMKTICAFQYRVHTVLHLKLFVYTHGGLHKQTWPINGDK